MTDLVEWVKRVAVETLKSNVDGLKDLIRECILFELDSEFVFLLEPLFIACKPSLKDLLSISHCVCEKCCDSFVPCRVEEWREKNPELFDSEVRYFNEILTAFFAFIVIDLEPLGNVEDFRSSSIPDTRLIRLRQLYTVILSFEI